jgi:hypothetical protein
MVERRKNWTRKAKRLARLLAYGYTYLSISACQQQEPHSMAKQKIRGLSAALLEQQQAGTGANPEGAVGTITSEPSKPVVQTVKVPPDVFIRLKTVGARERRSSQDIILSALTEYLERYPIAS